MFIGYDWGATLQAPPDAGIKGGNEIAKPSVHNHVIQVIQEMKSQRAAVILSPPQSQTRLS